VPTVCANRLTRSSSTIQRTRATASSGAPVDGTRGAQLLVLGGHRGDLLHPELVAHGVGRQLLQPVRHPPEVAHQVRQPAPPAVGDEAAVQQAAHLPAQVGDRGLGHPPPGRRADRDGDLAGLGQHRLDPPHVSVVSGSSWARAVCTSAATRSRPRRPSRRRDELGRRPASRVVDQC
jgi:hypothetical protein